MDLKNKNTPQKVKYITDMKRTFPSTIQHLGPSPTHNFLENKPVIYNQT